MDLKKLTKIVIALFFTVTISACQNHYCECKSPNQPTIIEGTKGNKNEAKLECDAINANVQTNGGSCIFYSK